VADAAAPTVVATFCASPTQSASINRAFGLAGPAAMTLKTTVRAHRCGDGRMGGSEECDDRNTHNGDGCDEICRVER
jgi:cysteine-rich repeat protein